MKFFTSEQVSKYHPDKYADQISDAVLAACLQQDRESRVACECMVKGKNVYLCGEITTRAEVNCSEVAKAVGKKLGYGVETVIQQITVQSPEIADGIKKGQELCAGDQGVMFGFACSETASRLPYGHDLANRIIALLEDDVANGYSILKGDAKCQVTVDMDMPRSPESVVEILVSACHKESYGLRDVREYINDLIQCSGIDVGKAKLNINPAGIWTFGGPEADCGLTGRKIICDQYGGYCSAGGGAFSGKDPSKVDRSGAYMARVIACELAEKYQLKFCTIQLAYAIGQANPMSVTVQSSQPADDLLYTEEVCKNYDLTPFGIIRRLNLLDIDYEKLSEGCHFRDASIGGLAI